MVSGVEREFQFSVFRGKTFRTWLGQAILILNIFYQNSTWLDKISKSLMHSPTVPNVFPNVDECKKFEIRAHSCWQGSTNQKYFIWTRFFLDNSKITITQVPRQLKKVRFIFANEHESACDVNLNFSSMIRIKKNITR